MILPVVSFLFLFFLGLLLILHPSEEMEYYSDGNCEWRRRRTSTVPIRSPRLELSDELFHE
jgi:hypothetical protein